MKQGELALFENKIIYSTNQTKIRTSLPVCSEIQEPHQHFLTNDQIYIKIDFCKSGESPNFLKITFALRIHEFIRECDKFLYLHSKFHIHSNTQTYIQFNLQPSNNCHKKNVAHSYIVFTVFEPQQSQYLQSTESSIVCSHINI